MIAAEIARRSTSFWNSSISNSKILEQESAHVIPHILSLKFHLTMYVREWPALDPVVQTAASAGYTTM